MIAILVWLAFRNRGWGARFSGTVLGCSVLAVIAGSQWDLARTGREVLLTAILPWIVGWVAAYLTVLGLNFLTRRGTVVFNIEIEHAELAGQRDGAPAKNGP